MSIKKITSIPEATQMYEETTTSTAKTQFSIEEIDNQIENNLARIASIEVDNVALATKKEDALKL